MKLTTNEARRQPFSKSEEGRERRSERKAAISRKRAFLEF